MKNILLTIYAITILIACQGPNSKKIQVVDNTTKIKKSVADDVVVSLEGCYKDTSCKAELEVLLPNWLLENSFVTRDDAVITDESLISKLPKNVTMQESKLLTNINLSSNYMKNELVRGALNEWLTWKRPQLINTWHYYQFLRKDIISAFDHYKIDEALVLAIMSQESGGKVHSRSRVGAGGLFQLMPATAKRLGLSGKQGAYDLRFNPKESALAAAKYIDEQSQLYNSDVSKILAAYNSGENRFRRLNTKYKNKSIWDKNFYYELPRETRHYVPVVIAAMLIFQNPEKFNVKLEQVNSSLLTVKLPTKSSLSEISMCLGQEKNREGWFRVLRNINSGIKADSSFKPFTEIQIPAILAETFEFNCKNQELMQLAQSLHEADFKARQGLFSYRIKRGDSLGKIARKFRCTTRKEIARLNKLKAPNYLIRAGKYLKIPQC